MKKIIIISLLLIVSIVFIASNTKDRDPGDNLNIKKQLPFAVDSKKLDANTISTWFRTNGSFNYTPSGSTSGFEWPKGSGKTARFASGLWLGAVVGNDTLVAIAEYDYEFLPGYTDNNGNPQAKDDPAYKIYKIFKGINNTDRQRWPNALIPGNSDQGAPVLYDPVTNSYKPLDFGSQTLFYVYTDSYEESHGVENGSTDPLKADVKRLDFAFNFGGFLGRTAFSQFIIINRSGQVWRDVYLTVWTDDDLGGANDDLVGCDTVRGVGYTWNATNNDPVYGVAPPAVGFDFFRGAIIRTNVNTDTAYVCNGKDRDTLVGYKQLGLSVFNWYKNDGSNDGNPRNFRETYRYMSGYNRLAEPRIHPSGYVTKYIYSGDPVTNTGWVQSGPTDQRFLQSTGPFDMAPNDTQIVIVGQIIEKGNSNLNSITELRNSSDFVQRKVYDNCFNVPPPPPAPNLTYFAPGNGRIYIAWDDFAERAPREFNLFNNSYYTFQGYNIYQVKAGTDGSNPQDRLLLATYDIVDGVTDIIDSVFVGEFNGWVWGIVQRGYDNGISRTFVLDRDAITGGSLFNGTAYYLSVVGYSYDSLSGASVGTPKVNEFPVSGNVVQIIPQALVQGTIVYYNLGDTILSNRKDLAVVPIVTEPISLISATYKSTFVTINNNLAWTLTRNNQILEENNADFSGTQDSAKSFDGFMLVHQKISDSGVVLDNNDPLRLAQNIHTIQRGWEYFPPQNLWVKGPDTAAIKTMSSNALFKNKQFQSRSMGLSFPHSSSFRGTRTTITANGTQFSPGTGTNPNLRGGPLRKVRIKFGQTQKAYRYVPVAQFPNDTNFGNTPYNNMVDVPFKVFAADDLDSTGGNERQLNCAFIDVDNNGIWDPDTTTLGKFQILYIFVSNYSETPMASYTTRNPGLPIQFLAFDILYVWVPRVNKTGPSVPTPGDVLEIYPYIITRPEFVPGYTINYSWNVQGTVIANSSIATGNNQMEKVNVFPNPYYGSSRLETNPFDRFIYFSNLPKECTIYIYTLNGVLVRKIQRNIPDARNSLHKWDLKNEHDIPVASGMYIALVDAPGIGTKVLKLAIFTPEERISTY